jgi:hypothetical protein
MENNRKESKFTALTSLFFNTMSNKDFNDASGEKEVIKASSHDDFLQKSLEYNQQEYLHRQWLNLNSSDRNKTMMYEANRISLYRDYQAMDEYPTIMQALNVLSEEATTIGHDGKMLTVTSNNKAVKQELQNLFENILSINTSLQFWGRNLCKYGDNFVYLILDKEKGVIGAKQLSNGDVERIETEVDGNLKVTFKYKNQIKGEEEFAIWQLAHFRMLGDDRRLPYGMSMLDGVRRTWKMLTLTEDAMMVYRITRAAERRVYKIDVGNLPSEDIGNYVKMVAAGTKRSKLIDPITGDFNWKYQVATNDSDLFIPVRGANAASPIETLAGAANLSDIDDIKYLRDNLYTGLGVPAAFLAFSGEGGAGDGKSLSMLDIRFSRKVNKIQQALISELNKIAIIHLYILGGDYLEHLDNFTLSLSNPSTQSELLMLESLSLKLDVYTKAVTPPTDTGIKPMSESMAKKLILNMSEEEILDDLIDQMLESKVGDEIKTAPRLIKSSKLFDRLIKYQNIGFFTTPNGESAPTNDAPADDAGMGDSMGGGLGGDMGGGLDTTTEDPLDNAIDSTIAGDLKEGEILIEQSHHMVKDLTAMLKVLENKEV